MAFKVDWLLVFYFKQETEAIKLPQSTSPILKILRARDKIWINNQQFLCVFKKTYDF